MKRYNVHLKESQLKRLEELAKDKEESVSRLIRDSIDKYLQSQNNE